MSDDKENKWFIAICIVIVTIGMSAICCPCSISFFGGAMPNYSEGERAGDLIKVSKKGMIWSSWEGQLVLNQFAIGAEGSNRFDFSTLDDDVGRELEKLAGKKVIIKYHQYFIGPVQQSTKYTVISVKEAK